MAGQLGADRRDGRGDDTAALLQRGLHRTGPTAAGSRQTGGDRGLAVRGPGVAGCRNRLDAWEYELLGQDFSNRGKRLDEMIPALRALWRGGWVSWDGTHYQVPEMMIEPHPPQPVPDPVRWESEAALRQAARLCDGWIGTAYSWDGAVAHVEAHRPAPRIRPRRKAVRDRAGAAGAAVAGPLQARRGRRHHRGDVRPWAAEPGIDHGTDVERFRPSIERFAESVVAKCR